MHGNILYPVVKTKPSLLSKLTKPPGQALNCVEQVTKNKYIFSITSYSLKNVKHLHNLLLSQKCYLKFFLAKYLEYLK